jgi:hypothetical protein
VEQVEQVELESAVVYGGGLAWREFAVHAKVYGKVVRIRSDAGCCRTLAYHFGGTTGVLAVYASDVCQSRDNN